MGRHKRLRDLGPVETRIESIAHDGRGVAHIDGKTTFIVGALPGELVRFNYTRGHRRFDEGVVTQVLEASDDRVEPRCQHFGVCSGCVYQHASPKAQIRFKQQVLRDNLERIGNTQPDRWLPPISSSSPGAQAWGYRRKARLSVRNVHKKGRVLVGFRELDGRFVAELSRCHTLVEEVGFAIDDLVALVEGMEAKDHVPQIEVAVGDDAICLIFRHLEPLERADRERLVAFGEQHDMTIAVQSKGPDSVVAADGATDLALHYRLAPDAAQDNEDAGFRFSYQPTDFVQVNASINRLMVQRALELLRPEPGSQVLELFCGLGNFTLPIAARAGTVTGVEGDAGLVARARENAAANHIDNVDYRVFDLREDASHEGWASQAYDALLLDPPRSGAEAILPTVTRRTPPPRVVYVSCNPATLARDCDYLVHRAGYQLEAAGVIDMFPHTAHVESMALLTRA